MGCNFLVFDGKTHVGINPKLFQHLSGLNIVCWKDRVNVDMRYEELRTEYDWIV